MRGAAAEKRPGIDITNVTGAPSTLLRRTEKDASPCFASGSRHDKSPLSRNYDRTGEGMTVATVRALANGRWLKPRSGTIWTGLDDPVHPRIDGNCSWMGNLHGFYARLLG